MQAFFSSEGSYTLQFLVIFLVILVLFLIGALLFMRLSGRGLSLGSRPAQRGRQPRLGIVDIYELDRQRQLILLRRDNVEHLLLVGGPNDVVIERHIQRGAGTRYAADPSVRAEGEIASAAAAPPDLPRTDPFFDSPAPPTFTMPEVVPAAVPGAQPGTDRAPPLDPGLFEPEEPPAVPRPASPVSRLMRRSAPPLVRPASEAGPAQADRIGGEALSPGQPTVTAEPIPEPPPPVVASREPRTVDPAVLSDMARQLQVALKRPASAVTPPPSPAPEFTAPPPAPKPADPIAAAMAAVEAAGQVPPAPPKAAAPAPQDAKPAAAPSPAAAEPKPAAPGTPVASVPELGSKLAPAPKSEPAKPEPSKPEISKPQPPAAEPLKTEPAEPAAQNPFSVEEIEAEFARLLGRPLDTRN